MLPRGFTVPGQLSGLAQQFFQANVRDAEQASYTP